MKKLYAPWRYYYIHDSIKRNKKSCIFCNVFLDTFEKKQKFVLYQGTDIAIMLNLYPYNSGHLLVFPFAHVEQLYETSLTIQSTLMQAISLSSQILKETLPCDALNVGANIGAFSGAGIPEHIHFHIVPRWKGDTGFLPIIAETKVISVDLEKIFQQLQPIFYETFLGKNL
ncbi:HIT domain-containing protein [Candidatus Dependentiae bacterium]|nr:HIT domain-containing protein [Candidatus Dependentiae bacterium]